eukprot:ctg_2989.g367
MRPPAVRRGALWPAAIEYLGYLAAAAPTTRKRPQSMGRRLGQMSVPTLPPASTAAPCLASSASCAATAEPVADCATPTWRVDQENVSGSCSVSSAKCLPPALPGLFEDTGAATRTTRVHRRLECRAANGSGDDTPVAGLGTSAASRRADSTAANRSVTMSRRSSRRKISQRNGRLRDEENETVTRVRSDRESASGATTGAIEDARGQARLHAARITSTPSERLVATSCALAQRRHRRLSCFPFAERIRLEEYSPMRARLVSALMRQLAGFPAAAFRFSGACASRCIRRLL